MSKKNKLTPNQDKYKELRRRLKRKLRDVKKRGMTPNRAFNEEWLGDEIPDKVRKSTLEKMQKALKININPCWTNAVSHGKKGNIRKN